MFANLINGFFVKRVSNFVNEYMVEPLVKFVAHFINGFVC